MTTPHHIIKHVKASALRGKGDLTLYSLLVDPTDEHLFIWMHQITQHQADIGRSVESKMALGMGDSYTSYVRQCAIATSDGIVVRHYAVMACLLFLMCNQHLLGGLHPRDFDFVQEAYSKYGPWLTGVDREARLFSIERKSFLRDAHTTSFVFEMMNEYLHIYAPRPLREIHI